MSVPDSAASPALSVEGIASVGCTVSDLDRSAAFFTDVLTFTVVSETEAAGEAGARARVARLQLGDATIELTQYHAPDGSGGRPMPADSRSNDGWFQHLSIIVRDIDAAYARLRAHGVRQVSPAPQRLPDTIKGAAGIRALYFHDPDGHTLELLQYPPDKGDAKWHAPLAAPDALFLGVDHTGIAVRDTAASLRFYRDALGMKAAGETLNEGIEQSRLTGVPDARVRITSLRFPKGMGIELLEYLTPRDGRPMPADVRAHDLFYWQTRVITPDVGRAASYARDHAFPVASNDVTTLSVQERGFSRAVLVRDPDRHGVQFVTP